MPGTFSNILRSLRVIEQQRHPGYRNFEGPDNPHGRLALVVVRASGRVVLLFDQALSGRALRDELAGMLPVVPLASLLVEVDARTGFTDHLVACRRAGHPAGGRRPPGRAALTPRTRFFLLSFIARVTVRDPDGLLVSLTTGLITWKCGPRSPSRGLPSPPSHTFSDRRGDWRAPGGNGRRSSGRRL